LERRGKRIWRVNGTVRVGPGQDIHVNGWAFHDAVEVHGGTADYDDGAELVGEREAFADRGERGFDCGASGEVLEGHGDSATLCIAKDIII
jgi:hypothetical protein